MKYFVLLILFLGANSFMNPVIDVDAPDPGILYYEGSYWVVTTGGNDKGYFVIRQSKDLVAWTEVGTIFTKESKPLWAVGDFWAPELHVINGHINAYFSAKHTNGRPTVGVAVSTTSSPAGPYKAIEQPLVVDPLGVTDVSVVKEYGTSYYFLIWRVETNPETKKNPILMAELNEDGTSISQEKTMLIQNDLPWEGGLVGGPWIHYHDGYYYLFYSGQVYTSPYYSVGVARSKSVTGPYIKSPGPVLSQVADNVKGQYFVGPGHNSIVTVPETNVDIMIYHSWLSGKIEQNPGRVVLIDKIWWKDGWPVVGNNGSPSHVELPLPISKEFADMPINTRLEKGKIITFSSYQWPDKCWNVNTGNIDGDCNDDNNKFFVWEGLKGPGTFSFESLMKPGLYWRHFEYKMVAQPSDGSELFKEDASFIAVAGFEDPTLVTLRPIMFYKYVVRHFRGNLVITEWNSTAAEMAAESTWRVNVQ